MITWNYAVTLLYPRGRYNPVKRDMAGTATMRPGATAEDVLALIIRSDPPPGYAERAPEVLAFTAEPSPQEG